MNNLSSGLKGYKWFMEFVPAPKKWFMEFVPAPKKWFMEVVPAPKGPSLGSPERKLRVKCPPPLRPMGAASWLLKPRIFVAIGIILLLLTPSPIQAQNTVLLYKGTTQPTLPSKYNWFWNTETLEIWHKKEKNWTLFRTDTCFKAEACHTMLLLQCGPNKPEIIWGNGSKSAFDPIGNELQCYESLLTVEVSWGTAIINNGSEIVAMMERRACPSIEIDTIQGSLGFCVPKFLQMAVGQVLCSEMRTWGILGENGRWLIPPIFDGPFRFQNGFAEVRYYGAPRKINEKGNFVE